MSFNNGPIVVDNHPSILHLFKIFKDFRNTNNYEGLVQYLTTNYPQNVKNRTFNFTNTGHTFHMLYAFIPSPSNKERKQIRLDCIEKLLNNTKNDFKLYEDLMKINTNNQNKCPCLMIAARLNDNIMYNESLKCKNFDSKPGKLKKEPIDAILFKYSINWKNSLNKKKCLPGVDKNVTTCSKKRSNTNVQNTTPIVIDETKIKSSTIVLTNICGQTVQQCAHVFTTQDCQLRAGDEMVSFIKYCIKCGCV
ncbi:lef-5 [Psilogramma increta granulovirus]|uniref:Lef-5 n=1 Tax=Psilogramma increta granulovirus TaxID=2953508 RepID=A0A977TNZ0_9BBAC|nr:lef-5 [Psilogramma increta granulovirus]